MLFPTLDFGSFTNIWYWIFLALFWSLVLNYPMGISVTRLTKAERSQAEADTLDHLAYVIAQPWLATEEKQRLVLTAIAAFSVGVVGALAFFYGSEFAFALLFFVVPGCCIMILTWRAIRAMEGGVTPLKALRRLRVQLIALSIPSLLLAAVTGGIVLIRMGLT